MKTFLKRETYREFFEEELRLSCRIDDYINMKRFSPILHGPGDGFSHG
jgi:hypothetical protein